MSCPCNCQKIRCLNAPCESTPEAFLVIGNVAAEDVTVYIKNETSGRTEKINSTIDYTGLVAIDMAQIPGFFHPNADYVLWVTEQNLDIMELLLVEINSVNYDCFRLTFIRTFVEDELEVLPIQYLEPEI